MCVRQLSYLACTNCNNQFVSITGNSYGETGGEVKEQAAQEGWIIDRQVPNGSLWDFCPKCKDKAP